jgi:GxxExxY protein
MPQLLHQDLTHTIIGTYYEVWNHTARTYPEFIYERAMLRELRARGIPCVQQDKYKILYKERIVGRQRLDIFVADQVVVENKATESITRLNKAQAISYLKTVGKSVGLVLNFRGSKPQFARVYWKGDSREPGSADPEHLQHKTEQKVISSDWVHADLAYNIVGGLFEVHRILGPGFIHRIYTNACIHELRLRGLDPRPMKEFHVYYKRRPIGKFKFRHLLVEGSVMVFPVAVRDTRRVYLEHLRMWMGTQGIKLGILANFCAESLEPVWMRV